MRNAHQRRLPLQLPKFGLQKCLPALGAALYFSPGQKIVIGVYPFVHAKFSLINSSVWVATDFVR